MQERARWVRLLRVHVIANDKASVFFGEISFVNRLNAICGRGSASVVGPIGTKRHSACSARLARVVSLICVALLMVVSACSGENETSQPTTDTTLPSNVLADRDRPTGPVADVSEELTGGMGVFMAAANGAVVPDGYVEKEFVAAGEATDYKVVGEWAPDGRWTFEPQNKAPYRTRVVVRYPEDPTQASGTVVVEWLNVSSGLDTNPDYGSFGDEMARNGDIWVGVSAQMIGVEGGPVLVDGIGLSSVGKGLKALDPERYGSLEHPGDGFSYDIFTQVSRAVREGGEFTGGIKPDVVLAAGESQSATAMVTYFNGVQPLTQQFDGFFVHSRASVALSIPAPGEAASLSDLDAIDLTPVLMRDDQQVPVLVLQAENDLVGMLNSLDVRQPDTDFFRLWEAAGTAHADAHLLGPMANAVECGVAVNNGPMHLIAKAALRALDLWVRDGTAPPIAERIEITDEEPFDVMRDADGISLGGIRTPIVDVPVDIVSGTPGDGAGYICELVGSTVPLPDERIAALYADRADYVNQFAQSADEAIAAGFILPADREALIAMSAPERIHDA